MNLIDSHKNGNKGGRVDFKIRRNDNMENFDKKLNEVSKNFKDMGLEIHQKEVKNTKPKHDITSKLDVSKSNQFTKNNDALKEDSKKIRTKKDE